MFSDGKWSASLSSIYYPIDAMIDTLGTNFCRRRESQNKFPSIFSLSAGRNALEHTSKDQVRLSPLVNILAFCQFHVRKCFELDGFK